MAHEPPRLNERSIHLAPATSAEDRGTRTPTSADTDVKARMYGLRAV
ncbi:hypothetical protein FB565_002958 [Actinoplanes lutulentus]|uniref:Uncharacterized protein n=1 Tax=Actinoplanes lutulentus TaxID=1287878 RepID=A0A327Z1L9_9ACTN|nr:hypothetical protein [Actinoplanes lutulentus]RAK28306.1 hypothetical protein B0I29_12074 [Actinoplanes lutulentus]